MLLRDSALSCALALAAMVSGASAVACGSSVAGSNPVGGPDAAAEASTGVDAGVDALAPPVDAAADGSNYASPSMWLCGANATHDYCLDPETATAIAPNLQQTTSTLTPLADPPLDCFYVYPSVDITSPPGNETNFDNLPEILDPVRSQAAPFSQVCKVYAPLYHQATFQSYQSASADQYLEVAYADVAAAFAAYMSAYNGGRPFVLIGHSQGSHMLRRLIQRVVEPSATIDQLMVLAILGGPLGDVTVPKGQVVGGSFQKTPLCTSASQLGCLITWCTFGAGYAPTSTFPDFPVAAGMDVGCSNPAAPGGGPATLSNSYVFTKYQSSTLQPPQTSGVSTDFATYAGFFTGQCTQTASGFTYFQVAASAGAGDQRQNPIPFGSFIYSPAIIGLHLLDFAFPMGDLLSAVRARSKNGSVDASSD